MKPNIDLRNIDLNLLLVFEAMYRVRNTTHAADDAFRADVYMAPHGPDGLITVGFGDVAYGYRDGYWDRAHTWHHWRNDADFRTYRAQPADNFHDWNHDRDSDNGWHDAR